MSAQDLSAGLDTWSIDLGDLFLEPARAVHGQVLAAEDGRPIAGARIAVASAGPWDTSAGDRPDATATTGADGAFAIEHVPAGLLRWRVRADARQPAERFQAAAGAGVPLVFRLPVGIGADFRGIVRDIAGEPVGAAVVRFDAWEVQGGPDGRFQLPARGEEAALLVASHPRSGVGSARAVAGEDVTIVLGGAGVLRVTAMTPDAPRWHNEAVELALDWVGMSSRGEERVRSPLGSTVRREGPTSWIVEGLWPGATYQVVASTAGGWRDARSGRMPDPPPREPAPWTLALEPPWSAVGRVTGSDGEPAAATRVVAVSAEAGPTRTSAVAADGSFRLAGLARVPYRLVVERSGEPLLDQDVTPPPGDRLDLALRIEAPAVLMGTALVPLPQAPRPRVSVEVGHRSVRRTVDVDGTFRIDGLPPGTAAVTLEPASRAGAFDRRQLPFRNVELTAGNATMVHFHEDVQRLHQVRVHLHGADGAPVPGLEVHLRRAGRGAALESDVEWLRLLASATADEGGCCVLETVGPGPFEVLVGGGLPSRSWIPPYPVHGVAGTTVAIDLLVPHGALDVQVRAADGAACADVLVVLARSEGLDDVPLAVRTDRAGRARCGPLRPGTYELEATSAGRVGRAAGIIVAASTTARVDVFLEEDG